MRIQTDEDQDKDREWTAATLFDAHNAMSAIGSINEPTHLL